VVVTGVASVHVRWDIPETNPPDLQIDIRTMDPATPDVELAFALPFNPIAYGDLLTAELFHRAADCGDTLDVTLRDRAGDVVLRYIHEGCEASPRRGAGGDLAVAAVDVGCRVEGDSAPPTGIPAGVQLWGEDCTAAVAEPFGSVAFARGEHSYTLFDLGSTFAADAPGGPPSGRLAALLLRDEPGPRCPTLVPHLWYASWYTDLPNGTVCAYPAEACAPGTLPDNVCTVDRGDFVCSVPFHNCLPLRQEGVYGLFFRELPAHRPAAVACPSTDGPSESPGCQSLGGYADACADDADCGASERCLETHYFGAETVCQCHASQCQEDADCGDQAVCRCGETSDPGWGGCATGQSCMHQCAPAACRVDADCGAGRLCSPSFGPCGVVVQGYHCHDPSVDECFSDLECGAYGWGYGGRCRYLDGGWRCEDVPVCD
jgi:hypothetical protein